VVTYAGRQTDIHHGDIETRRKTEKRKPSRALTPQSSQREKLKNWWACHRLLAAIF
jgi:hypothetical protein